MDFSRTIPSNEEPWWIESLFDGTRVEAYFPLRGVPKDATVGDWLYVIFRKRVVGRCKIVDIEVTNEAANVGPDGQILIDARCLVYVKCPGERAPREIIRGGHQGIRYDRFGELSREFDLNPRKKK